MSSLHDLLLRPESFNGVVRLFPLPNLVMFPHVMQPLHVFEPRYAAMVEDALLNDQLIAMSVLRPGWEKDYDGRPPIEPVVCIGHISSHSMESSGRYNILLSGVQRALVDHELPPSQLYREAKVTLLEDCYAPHGTSQRSALHRQLADCFRERLPNTLSVRKQFEQLFGKSAPLGILVDVIAFTLDLPLDEKQGLLSESSVDNRARRLLELLTKKRRPNRESENGFPPAFSLN